MPQNNTVMAFRKRLKNIGYTDISVTWSPSKSREIGQKVYTVSAREPLANTLVKRNCTMTELHNMFH